MKTKISITVTRANGHTSKLSITDPPPAMLLHAESLVHHMTDGLDPARPCRSCGRPRNAHPVRHPFVEP